MIRRHRKSFAATLAAAATATAFALPGQAEAGSFEPLVRASLGQQETESNAGVVDRPSISEDGRYTAFASEADNLVAGDEAQWIDIFLRDQLTRTTKRINVSVSGGEADGASFAPQISANGRYITYDSYATNLTSGDTNGASDVFLYDTLTEKTRRISTTADGKAADGDSTNPSISADGRYVAYDSYATDLVADDTNGSGDVFIWDRVTNKTIRASVGPNRGSTAPSEANGSSGLPSISADGTRVAFVSAASNLASGDTNGVKDVYVRDLRAGRTFIASLGADAQLADMDSDAPAISAEGNHVAFHTPARLSSQDHDRGVDVYVRDLSTGSTALASGAMKTTKAFVQRGISYSPSLSGDGRFVSFTSFANDLVPGDRDRYQEVFLRDTLTGAIIRAAVNLQGIPASAASFGSVLNAAGTQLAFGSEAANLVEDDTNKVVDAFVRAVPSTLPASAPTPPGGPRVTGS